MEKAVLHRILDTQDAALEDPVYLELSKEYKDCIRALRRMLNKLDSRQRETLYDYLDIGVRMHLRLMELACRENDKKPHDL